MIRLITTFSFALIGIIAAPIVNDPSEHPRQEKQSEDKKLPIVPKDTLPDKIDLHSIPDGLDDVMPFPKSNPLKPEVVSLGRKIFFDPILSEDNSVSCASCHQPELAFASNNKLAVGIGGKLGRRNSPTLVNRAYGKAFFWDGRAASLEEQALAPISSELELGSSVEKALERISSKSEYVSLFENAFGKDSINKENLAKALAAFQRTLLMGNSPVDQFQSANYSALNDQERQGLWIYESRGGCWKCHSGGNYSDEEFHNTGVSFDTTDRDKGLAEFSGKETDNFKFKTPTLRGVALTAPYFHDGSAKTLEDVVEFYSKGGATDDPNLDPKMKKLDLSDEDKKNLVAFLKALSRS